jgi:hypothetical protein
MLQRTKNIERCAAMARATTFRLLSKKSDPVADAVCGERVPAQIFWKQGDNWEFSGNLSD